jgi:hypothetical protein
MYLHKVDITAVIIPGVIGRVASNGHWGDVKKVTFWGISYDPYQQFDIKKSGPVLGVFPVVFAGNRTGVYFTIHQ